MTPTRKCTENETFFKLGMHVNWSGWTLTQTLESCYLKTQKGLHWFQWIVFCAEKQCEQMVRVCGKARYSIYRYVCLSSALTSYLLSLALARILFRCWHHLHSWSTPWPDFIAVNSFLAKIGDAFRFYGIEFLCLPHRTHWQIELTQSECIVRM